MAIDTSGRRTYIPRLLLLLKLVCRYIVRYQTTINSFLTPTQRQLLSAVMVACEAFTEAVEIVQGD